MRMDIEKETCLEVYNAHNELFDKATEEKNMKSFEK